MGPRETVDVGQDQRRFDRQKQLNGKAKRTERAERNGRTQQHARRFFFFSCEDAWGLVLYLCCQ